MSTEGTSSVLQKAGTFSKVLGFDVANEGLKRLGGWEPFYTGNVNLLFGTSQSGSRNLQETIEDFFVMNLQDGTTKGLVVTNRLIYEFSKTTGFTPVPWSKAFVMTAYDGSGTNAVITVADDEVTNSLLSTGDWLKLSDGNLYYLESASYNSTTEKTTLTITGKPSAAPSTGFTVYKPFKTASNGTVDWAIGRNYAWFVDGITLAVFKYTGDYVVPVFITDPTTNARSMYTAKSITCYKDRLYFANVIEPDGAATIKPTQRIRWTEVLDWSTSSTSNYLDLTYHPGQHVAIRGSDTLLLVFSQDAVYYGVQSNLTGLPYSFYELQTGGVTAVGPKAVTTLLGSCIFVSHDDIYAISMTEDGPTINKIGTPIARTMLDSLQNSSKTIAKVDVDNSRVFFGIPAASSGYSKLWFWSYKTKGWSYCETPTFQCLAVTNYVYQLTMDEFETQAAGATFDNYSGASLPIDSFNSSSSSIDLYGFDTNNFLYKYNAKGLVNYSYSGSALYTQPVPTLVETQDIDFDMPDSMKSFLIIGVKLAYNSLRTTTMKLRVEVSLDRGRTWRLVGTMVFAESDDEDKLNLRVTASSIRFRFTSGSSSQGTGQEVPPWTMEEITVRARIRSDREPERSTNRA